MTKEAFDKIKAGLDEALEYARNSMSGWQSIETAPKDGTEILVYGLEYSPAGLNAVGGTGVTIVSWKRHNKASGGWARYDDPEVYLLYNEPSHWMPLPKPPEVTA